MKWTRGKQDCFILGYGGPMSRMLLGMLTLIVTSSSLAAQNVTFPPAERQIAAAVSPLPEPLQKGAKVLGYAADGKLTTLRPGTNEMICVADNPANRRFHVACYHRSLDPFMSRGRELRAQKMTEDGIDSVRLRDVKAGRLKMPAQPAVLYQYFAARDSVDGATGTVNGAQYLYVVYTPYATYKTTGIAETPVAGGPWIMFPGTPFAHLMISPQKTATVIPR